MRFNYVTSETEGALRQQGAVATPEWQCFKIAALLWRRPAKYCTFKPPSQTTCHWLGNKDSEKVVETLKCVRKFRLT